MFDFWSQHKTWILYEFLRYWNIYKLYIKLEYTFRYLFQKIFWEVDDYKNLLINLILFLYEVILNI